MVTAHPDFASGPDVNFFAWEANGYARLVLAGPELERVRASLALRAAKADADARPARPKNRAA